MDIHDCNVHGNKASLYRAAGDLHVQTELPRQIIFSWLLEGVLVSYFSLIVFTSGPIPCHQCITSGTVRVSVDLFSSFHPLSSFHPSISPSSLMLCQ